MNTKRSSSGSTRRRSAHDVKEPTGLRDKRVSRSAWYPDPFGVAGERWWDGGKWTQEVRGEAQAQDAGPAPDRRQVKGTTRPPAERRAAEPEKQRLSWLVALGYLAAVFFPIAGLALGIAVIARPGARSSTRHGIQIIAISIVVFALGLALAHHR